MAKIVYVVSGKKSHSRVLPGGEVVKFQPGNEIEPTAAELKFMKDRFAKVLIEDEQPPVEPPADDFLDATGRPSIAELERLIDAGEMTVEEAVATEKRYSPDKQRAGVLAWEPDESSPDGE